MIPLSKGQTMLKLAQFKLFSNEKQQVDIKCIELLLQQLDLNSRVPSTEFLEEHNSNLIGDTLLHIAFKEQSIKVFEMLLRKGADFNIKNNTGCTVLHTIFHSICSFVNSSKWNILESKNTDIKQSIPFIASTLSAHIQYKNTSNPSDSNGLTHFHIACATNNIKAAEFFLTNGVSIDETIKKAVKDNFEGYTALHFAARFGYLEMTEILLKHGANTSLEDAKGKKPLYISLERNIAMIDSMKQPHEDIQTNEEVIELLLNHHHSSELSRLHIFSSMQFTIDIENFLDNEIENLLDNKVENLFDKEIGSFSDNEMENLVDQEFDINQCISEGSRNWPGYTALHFAAHVNVDTVKLLMKHGANILAKDASGVTPFELCLDRYKTEDLHGILRLTPGYKNIVLSDEKTKLSKLLLALTNESKIILFLQKSYDKIKLSLPSDSPLWPGFTLLHIAVLLSERKNCKHDYRSTYSKGERDVNFEPDLSVITQCLQRGADMSVKDIRNWTPVHLAFRLKKDQTANLLLQYHYRMSNPTDDDNLSHLHIACALGNRNFVERLLYNDADVNIVYKGKSSIRSITPGMTPLHIAINTSNNELVNLLLRFGADPHKADDNSFTPTHNLILHSSLEEAGENILSSPKLSNRLVKSFGLSYLHVACSFAHYDAIKKLLDLGANVNGVITLKNVDSKIVNTWNRILDENTPLLAALSSWDCSFDVVNLLIQQGADILFKNSSGDCPLSKMLDVANSNLYKILCDSNLQNLMEKETGVTMLHVACRIVNVDLMKELLDNGVDVNAKIHEDSTFLAGSTPLHMLLLNNKVDDDIVIEAAIKLMLDFNTDVTMSDSSRQTPLHLAYDELSTVHADYWESYRTRVNLLLKAHKNFNVNPKNINGISHFHIACQMLDVDVVETFLQHNVDLNARIEIFYKSDSAACTPLLLATRKTNWRQMDEVALVKIVDLLIQYGAQLDDEDMFGNTAVHYASYCSSPAQNYLHLLANGGANMNATNVKAETPISILIKNENLSLEYARYFITCGCNFNSFNPVTDEGYIGEAAMFLSDDDLKCLLRDTFTIHRGSRKNAVNRTAIHNFVSIATSDLDEDWYIEMIDVTRQFGCDIDDQDNLGRTALHLAAQFGNRLAVASLLLLGADINITDYKNRSPIDYAFDSCEPKEKEEFSNFTMFTMFVNHINKLKFCDCDVSDLNLILLAKIHERFRDRDYLYSQEKYGSVIRKMMKLKIKPFSITLEDFIYDADAIYDYPRMSETKRNAICSFFQKNEANFRDQYKTAAGIFQLQYRKALLRLKIIDAAYDALSVLVKFRLPYVCCQIILRFLKNSDLQQLIISAS